MTPGNKKPTLPELVALQQRSGLSVVRNDGAPSALVRALGQEGETPAQVVQVEPTPEPSMEEMLAGLDDLLTPQEQQDIERRAAMRATLAQAVVTGAAKQAAQAALPAVQPQARRVAQPVDEQAAINLVNSTHAIAPLAGEATIHCEGTDPETGAKTLTPVSQGAFHLAWANVFVDVLQGGGAYKRVQVADLWLRSPHRREYSAVVLQPEGKVQPGAYNLWNGFGVTPSAGDASLMLDHIDMLCGGTLPLIEYVLNWMAFCVQRPGSRPEVALVFRGGQGTGKGTAIRALLKIFGRNSLHITQPRHLTGNFNSHLRYALFVFVDEGFWAGDKSGEGVLKGLITEPTLTIEMKGRDVFDAPNRLKLAFASNSGWVVPAGADERRYCVVDVPNTRAQDHAYFAALNAWLDVDGAAIFLDHLRNRDLSGFNVRAVPKTAALDRQKVESMGALDRFILEALDTAEGIGGDDWAEAPQRVTGGAAAFRFETYCRRTATRGLRPDTRTIGRRFAEVFGCGPATSTRIGTDTKRAWTLPGITDARRLAAAAFGLAQYEWGQA